MTTSTIQDVAARAGVSVSTVSNVLNGRESRMRAETLQRVQKAIDDLGFRPNQSARMLKTGHMPMLGLMVPTIANPYYGILARWIEARARERGYGLLLCNTYRNAERERAYAETFLAQGVRGVILGSALVAHEHLIPLVDQGLAAVSLDRASASDGILRDFVSVDNHLAASMAIDHLISLGHRKIAFVNGPARSANRVARLAGAREACARGGAELCEFVGQTNGEYNEGEMAELGRSAARELLAGPSRSTALVGVNDMVAIGLLAGVRQSGKRVPEDLSVVGIDGIFLGDFTSPTLTSVKQPMEAIASAAVDHVLTRMKNPGIEPQATVLPPSLNIGGSSGPVPGAR